MLFGYFQSYKYFQDNFDKILEIINIESFKKKIREKNKELFVGDTISMHFTETFMITCPKHGGYQYLVTAMDNL